VKEKEAIPYQAPQATQTSGVSFGLRHVMFGIVVIALALAAIVQYPMVLLVLGILLVPPAGILCIFLPFARRGPTYQEALLRVMAISAERSMPLAPGVQAFGTLCGGGYRRRVLALSYLLDAGVPLPQALANVPGVLPKSAIVLACVGWSEGALASSLREAIGALEIRKAYRNAFLPKIGYLFGTFMVMQLIVGGLLYFITPKLMAIYQDFGTTVPPFTAWVTRAGNWAFGSGLLFLLSLLELVIIVYIPFSYFGWVRWDVPFLERLYRRRDAAAILRSLAIGVDGGRPMSSSLALLAGFYPRNWVRERLRLAYRSIEEGRSWFDSLRIHGLIRAADAAVLESAQRTGNLSWALRAMADGNDRSLGYRLNAISQVIFPILVILLGLIVALIAISYFLPLVTLIESLA
jgi:protein transport protein HofC